MSTFVHVDSRWRDRSNTDNANPAQFEIPNSVVKGWRTKDRTVLPVRPHDKVQATNLVHNVNLLDLTVPYDIGGDVSNNIVNLCPFLYVELDNGEYNQDKKLINTLENGLTTNTTPSLLGPTISKVTLKDSTFLAMFDKVQFSNTGEGAWIHYKGNGMNQVYRIDTTQSLKFRVFSYDGVTLPIVDNAPPTEIIPARQISAFFELTPYVRDADFDNHNVPLYSSDA